MPLNQGPAASGYFPGNLDKDPNGTPEPWTRMPKDKRRHDPGAALHHISVHFPGMQAPIGSAGYKGKDEFASQQFGRIMLEKIDHRSAQVV
jgi:hypothetical protein